MVISFRDVIVETNKVFATQLVGKDFNTFPGIKGSPA